jgi:hypothetical protein
VIVKTEKAVDKQLLFWWALPGTIRGPIDYESIALTS